MNCILRSVAFALVVLLAGCSWLDRKSSEDVTASWSAQRLYTEAREAMGNGDYKTAVGYFEKLEARYPFGRYAQQAQLEIAYAYYRENEPASAVAACDRFIKLHPNHPNVDYAYYLKGVVRFSEDQSTLARLAGQDPTERDPASLRDSFFAFKELVTRYPESRYTPDALARMKWLLNALASHDVSVARFYMKREAYVAAANRAQSAIKNYPDAPAVEEALYIMAQAYAKLGMKDLQASAERVLQTNFPESPYLKGGKVDGSRWWEFWKL